MAGRSSHCVTRIARSMYTPEMLAESMTKIAGFTEEAERPAGTVRGGLFIFTCVHDDRDTALAMVVAVIAAVAHQSNPRSRPRPSLLVTASSSRRRPRR